MKRGFLLQDAACSSIRQRTENSGLLNKAAAYNWLSYILTCNISKESILERQMRLASIMKEKKLLTCILGCW
ncbi:MAG TPA: hypothetical protein PKE30_10075 [Niabella sp.]|nr:hypothetical protein [Niabella sp.]